MQPAVQVGAEPEAGADRRHRAAALNLSQHYLLLQSAAPHCRWVKSVKLVQTAATGPLLSYKLKPAEGWKLATEASLRSRTLAGSMTFKALKGE